ncbi:hypothetical protein BDV93DRAFT_601074 [Ceratobasidium sp. AG-I]|nr:hypothetical protein BDV93DRAFT_601074 [Ceratobasidium sp. AG-I]
MANSSSNFSSKLQQHTTNLIRAIERVHNEESETHIIRAENISRENDRLRKELYDLQQRVNILTDRLGFDNLERAEESLGEDLVNAVQQHKASTARIEDLTAELATVKDQLAAEQASRIEDEQYLENLKADLERKRQSTLEAQSESELNREALGRLKLELQAEWQKTSKLESTVSSLRKDKESMVSECEALKAVMAKDRAQRASLAPETPLRAPPLLHIDILDGIISKSPSPAPPLAPMIDSSLSLEAQLTRLRSQYDELLAAKTKISEKYARDSATWKDFKESVRNSNEGGGLVMSEGGIRTRRRVPKHARDSPTPATRSANVRLAQLTTDDNEVIVKEEEGPLPPMDLAPIPRLQLEVPPSTGALQRGLSSATSNTDTQDSQIISPMGQLDISGDTNDPPMQTPAIHKQAARLAVTIKQGSQSDDEGSVLLRKQIGTVAPLTRSHSSPAQSPHPIKKPPASVRVLGKRKAFVFDGEDDSSEEQSLSPAPNKTLLPEPDHQNESREDRDARLRALRRKSGPQVLAEYQQYKGRGRYAAGPSKPSDKTINSEFEINPTRNDGMAFEYDSVVRDKNERRKMNAGDCIACKEYYEAVGPMPKRAGAPLWRSPPPEDNQPPKPHTCKHHHGQGATTGARVVSDPSGRPAEKEADLTAHKQAISRHRHKWAPASTPPGYWNIGFPDTQQVADINRQAGELHDQKRNAIEQEAGREGGRYRKRA